MLQNAYIELTTLAGHDGKDTSPHHLDPFTHLQPGIRLLLLECSDANEKNAQLRNNFV